MRTVSGTDSPISESLSFCAKTSCGVPNITDLPLSITRTISELAAMSFMLCETSMIVLFSLSCIVWTILRMSACACGSRPAVGSSSISIFGLIAITPAIATRLFCPPERSKGDFSLTLSKSRPTSSIADLTRSSMSSCSRPRLFGPKATSFSTVSSKSWYSGY